MNNVKMVIKKGINKNNKEYQYIQFQVYTSAGVYSTAPIFPSPLELAVLSQSINNSSNTGISDIYSNSDTSLNAEF